MQSSGRWAKWGNKGAVITYCPTVKRVKHLYKWLKARDYPVGKYHGKMKRAKRSAEQAAFMSGRKPVMVATNAFGLGNRQAGCPPDHFTPACRFRWTATFRRSAAPGVTATSPICVLLYAKADFERNKRILSQSGGKKAVRRKLKRLNALQALVSSDKCLWRVIEHYFGEKPQHNCGKCCRCRR